jgi:carbamoyl-phosphate synthase large subunit
MRSTGEVLGMDEDLGVALAKTQMAAKPALPMSGNVFLSVKDKDKEQAVDLVRQLTELGFVIYSTSGTAAALTKNGLPVHRLFKLDEGRPNVLDMIKNGNIQMVINTPSGMIPLRDENKIRTVAIAHNVCIMTSISAAYAALGGIRALREKGMKVRSLQDYYSTLDNTVTLK